VCICEALFDGEHAGQTLAGIAGKQGRWRVSATSLAAMRQSRRTSSRRGLAGADRRIDLVSHGLPARAADALRSSPDASERGLCRLAIDMERQA